jgi:CRP-like cAMP-binding protein
VREQGDPVDGYYFIVRGYVSIYTQAAGAPVVKVRQLT